MVDMTRRMIDCSTEERYGRGTCLDYISGILNLESLAFKNFSLKRREKVILTFLSSFDDERFFFQEGWQCGRWVTNGNVEILLFDERGGFLDLIETPSYEDGQPNVSEDLQKAVEEGDALRSEINERSDWKVALIVHFDNQCRNADYSDFEFRVAVRD